MSSRQEEKEKRRAEREAAEAEAARKAANKGRLQLALGALVAAAAIALAVVIISGSGDGGDGGGTSAENAPAVPLPEQKETNLQTAAETANCELASPAIEGSDHTTNPEEWVYETNPPTSGPHHPEWYEDGLYESGNTPELGKLVHPLEHGRIVIQYKPGSPKDMVDRLETLGSEELQFGEAGYHVLVAENTTEMEPAVAATAWGQSLTCAEMSDGVYDAVRAFRAEYTDKGPELVP